jgi:hypothetical protein
MKAVSPIGKKPYVQQTRFCRMAPSKKGQTVFIKLSQTVRIPDLWGGRMDTDVGDCVHDQDSTGSVAPARLALADNKLAVDEQQRTGHDRDTCAKSHDVEIDILHPCNSHRQRTPLGLGWNTANVAERHERHATGHQPEHDLFST